MSSPRLILAACFVVAELLLGGGVVVLKNPDARRADSNHAGVRGVVADDAGFNSGPARRSVRK